MNILVQQTGETSGYHGVGEQLAVRRKIMGLDGFAEARRLATVRLVQLFSGDYLLNRLMLEEGRYTTIQAMLALAACQQAEERCTWLTLGRLQARLSGSPFASRNRIEALVAILERYGFVERRKAEDDLRVTLITPTARLWGADALLVRAFTGPFLSLFRDKHGCVFSETRIEEGEGPVDPQAPAWSSRDLASAGQGHRAWHRSLAPHLDGLFRLRSLHPAFQDLASRDGGYLVLLLALEQCDRTGSNRMSMPYETVSNNTGVSRTHARQLVEQAEAHGFLRLHAKGGREMEVTETLQQAADAWFADHMIYLLAQDTPR